MATDHQPPTGDTHWFEPIAAHLGSAYLRYSFTRGTAQEVRALTELGRLRPGDRVLDVGCGPGRHALGLAEAGFEVVGVDVSAPFVDLARSAAAERGLAGRARFEVLDARLLAGAIGDPAPDRIGAIGDPAPDRIGAIGDPAPDRIGAVGDPAPDRIGAAGRDSRGLGRFDLVYSLCQGAFGLTGGPGAEPTPDRELDEPILAGMAAGLRPGGRLVLSAFSAYFQLRYLEDGDDFDADLGVNHEHTTIRDPDGVERPTELWTTCYTPRELRLLARSAGLVVDGVHGVTPGAYRPGPPRIDCPEFLLVARAPGDPVDGTLS
ncbi:MAG: SAM-dependent methyltransferase [Acidimicrobiales bacterium]